MRSPSLPFDDMSKLSTTWTSKMMRSKRPSSSGAIRAAWSNAPHSQPSQSSFNTSVARLSRTKPRTASGRVIMRSHATAPYELRASPRCDAVSAAPPVRPAKWKDMLPPALRSSRARMWALCSSCMLRELIVGSNACTSQPCRASAVSKLHWPAIPKESSAQPRPPADRGTGRCAWHTTGSSARVVPWRESSRMRLPGHLTMAGSLLQQWLSFCIAVYGPSVQYFDSCGTHGTAGVEMKPAPYGLRPLCGRDFSSRAFVAAFVLPGTGGDASS
mmetsp:Transcript_43471/g.107504  ORF Transcript_43471/g.107504 Transcript_43471/m.107504 type:complete len:273 (+) Transcript_43471:387-1205(+)